MKIYTKTGDDGTTGLYGGNRVSKNHPRVAAYGTVDELNSVLGVTRAQLRELPAVQGVDELLAHIQPQLMKTGSMVATPPQALAYPHLPKLTEDDVAFLETAIDRLTEDLTPLKRFILPGGALPAATLHHARSVCRRGERMLVHAAAHPEGRVDPIVVRYLNRLSDLLFTAARWVNAKLGIPEQQWTHDTPPPADGQ